MGHQLFIDLHKKCISMKGKGIEVNKLTHHHHHDNLHEEMHRNPEHHHREENHPNLHSEHHLHRNLSSLHLGSKKRITLKF